MNTRIDKVKGVNLGNWLVLEKWMSPELLQAQLQKTNTICRHSFQKRYMRQEFVSTGQNIFQREILCI